MATQFKATPPARHRFLAPVSAASERVSRNITSSVTFCTEAAMSMWNCVSSFSGVRTGSPNRRLNLSLVIVSPVQ